MEQITEQDIINAIVALDAEKLKEIKESLLKTYNTNKSFTDTCCQKLKVLEDAGFEKCPEYEAICTEYSNANASSTETISLIEKCTKALKSLNY